VPAELVVFVALFFLLRRRHRLRKGQRQRIAVVRARLAALLLRQPYLDRHRGVHRHGTGLNGCVVSQKRRQKATDFLVS
jgi:hypothetical protein